MTGNMLVQEPVQATIWHCLNHYCFKDATFLAERLLAEVDSEESLYLVATCYYRAGKIKHAYSTLQRKGAKSPQCKYLLAKCCFDLTKLSEAESILLGSNVFKQKTLDDVILEFGDASCFVLLLLGEIYAQTERLVKASEALSKASSLNPFLWSSFELRCQIGDKPNPATVFQLSHLDNFASCHGSNPVVTLMGNQQLNASGLNKSETVTRQLLSKSSTPYSGTNEGSLVSTPLPPFIPVFHHNVPDVTPEDQKIVVNGPCAPISTRPVVRIRSMLNYSPLTPSFGVLPLESSSSDISQSSLALMSPVPSFVTNAVEEQQSSRKLGMRKDWASSRLPSVFSQSGNTVHHLSSTPGGALSSTLPSPQGPIRRSSRLFSSSNSVKENNKAPSKTRTTTTKSPLRKTKGRMTRSSGLPSISDYTDLNEKNRGPEKNSEKEDKLERECSVLLENKLIMGTPTVSYQHLSQQAITLQKQSAEGLMELMRAVGEAYLSLSLFDCRKAIDKFNDLPLKHFNTGWVLTQLAKAHFELSQYEQSVYYFEQVRDVDPSQTEGMEYYSVALWHLHQEVALSSLAQLMIAEDKNSASTWCCAGNCFSLQKEHDAAIKFFQRAIQVNPRFPYAYTLLGHEYILTEEMDKAMNCFRNAIRIDSRHYNAWCGIGMIYYKQERYEMAELNYRRALSIHSQSSIVMCHMGVVLNALQRTEKALQMLNKGLELDPRHPLCKFHRASIYFASEHFEEALAELDELKHIVPREALVYFLMGKVHKKLGATHLALKHFSWAMDLDPKGANHQIKEAIDPVLSRLTSADDPLSSAIAQDSTVEVEATPGNLQNSSALSSQESLELPQIPLMDSDESF